MSDQAYPLTPSLAYRDPEAAMEWLQRAFGCEIDTLLTDKDGKIAHLVMSFRGQPFGVMREWESEELIGPAKMRSPASLDARGSSFMRASVEDLAAHHERALAAGARITQGPTLQFYGDRTFRCLDLEGHVWNFQQKEVDVSLEEIERSQGFKTIKA
ncbi:MAG TPA: VOC family protein [Caulobacteraceae bacterium]|jgi:uncharacterized glyoxalase superfamily protein PhnB|nr:VOC family protein [Caulobacteraceae bacterium]